MAEDTRADTAHPGAFSLLWETFMKKMKNNKDFSFRPSVFLAGMRDGVPIGLGYLAVAFALGIAAKKAGLTAGQGFTASILCSASAGEFAGFTLIREGAPYIMIALTTLVINARYLLMSFSLSQRFSPDTPIIHRFLVGSYITDEIFGITIAQKGYVNPWYTYGAILVAVPLWAIGTAAGVIAGSLLPAAIVAALGVMLYGMFLCIFIPPARKDHGILCLVIICFGASFAASVLPYVKQLSSGNRTLILTVLISAAAALIAPRKEEEQHD